MNQLEYILNQSLSLFIIIPLLAFLATLFWQNKSEKPIGIIVQFTKVFYIIISVAFAVLVDGEWT